MAGVPTVYAGLLSAIEQQNKPFIKPTKMKLAICGAAPLSPDLQKKFSDKMGIPLVEGYGSTEGSSVSTLMPVNPINDKQSVGLILPNLSLKIFEINEDGETTLNIVTYNTWIESNLLYFFSSRSQKYLNKPSWSNFEAQPYRKEVMIEVLNFNHRILVLKKILIIE